MADKAANKGKYKALVGLDYPPGRRVEAGDVVDDIPATSLKWLLEGGLVEAYDAAAPGSSEEDSPAVRVPDGKDGGSH